MLSEAAPMRNLRNQVKKLTILLCAIGAVLHRLDIIDDFTHKLLVDVGKRSGGCALAAYDRLSH
jgi:hypothetical protein